MLRLILVAIFPAAMLASGVIANAQSVAWNGIASSGSWTGPKIHQSSTQQQTTSHRNSASAATATKRASNFGSTQHNGSNHHTHHHHNNASSPWWSRSVYINAGTADQYLPTPTPKPKPKSKNKATQPGVEVFKSISN